MSTASTEVRRRLLQPRQGPDALEIGQLLDDELHVPQGWDVLGHGPSPVFENDSTSRPVGVPGAFDIDRGGHAVTGGATIARQR
ncbi:MAG: hypothetical protein M5U09_03005 [Gammaproteobacteria bacterium]|nr:hypothetical protein [Gammaproteobacteria bacterium]